MQKKILILLTLLFGVATAVSGYLFWTTDDGRQTESTSSDKQIPIISSADVTGQSRPTPTVDEIKKSNTTYHLPLTTQTENSTTSLPEKSVSLKIDNTTFPIPYFDHVTAEDAMKYAHETYPEQFWYESIEYGSDLGTFVTTINGTAENYKEKMHWILYINGKKSNKGISTLILNPDDIIKWNYEKEIL